MLAIDNFVPKMTFFFTPDNVNLIGELVSIEY
jgi:hypothetical protein